MELLVAGLSHHTAPLALRERAAVGALELPRALERLVGEAGFEEGLILSTCNRTELYARPRAGAEAGRDAALGFLASVWQGCFEEFLPHVYLRESDEAVTHLFRVAAGLDSMVVGEHEILRQMGEAYGLSCSAGAAGAYLHRAVPRAIQVGKRVRTETGIARGIVSVAGAAVGLADRVFRDLEACSLVTIGAGATVETALRALRPRAQGPLIVLNRSAERAERLAAAFGGTPASLGDAAAHAARADIVIAATGATDPVLTTDELTRHLAPHRSRPLLVLDLGVPRDVEAGIGELPGVFLHNVDDLRAIAERGLRERAAEVPKAEALVTMAVGDFRRRRRELEAEPAIRALLDSLLEVRRETVDRERGLTADQRDAAERVTGKLIDRILRRLAPRMKDGTTNPRELLDAFGVEDDDGR